MSLLNNTSFSKIRLLLLLLIVRVLIGHPCLAGSLIQSFVFLHNCVGVQEHNINPPTKNKIFLANKQLTLNKGVLEGEDFNSCSSVKAGRCLLAEKTLLFEYKTIWL